MIRAIATSTVLLLVACGGTSPKPAKITAANAAIGDCVDARSAGVLSSTPRLRAAHRDLNGDGSPETVFADGELCRNGNCYWNLFSAREGCLRYVGTIGGATLEVVERAGGTGFRDLRGWWKLPGGERQLVQNYQFRGDGYRLGEVLLCRQEGDDQLLCAAEE